MSHFVVDDSEVIIGHQEEIAGAMEREGSLQNRGEKESWLADTEPYRGARPRMRDFDRMVDEELGATTGGVEDGGNSPTMVLEETVGRLQRDLEELQLENRFLKTPKAVKSVPLVRQAAFTTTKVPWFDGSTSWEQYLQVFEAIVLSNGWGDATAALQLLSHLQGDALSVALLTPLPLQATRKELTDALSSHYGSPGRLANYRREFDKTVREMGEDPSNFAIKLETLAVKAFGNMGQVARLRLIRDRFIAGHANCDLRRYLDCVPPDTPLRDIVDRCRVWESHGSTETRRVSKPIPDPVYPTYVVEQPDYDSEPVCMVSVNKQNSQVDQTEELLKKLLEALTPVKPIKPPVRTPDSITLDKLSELLMSLWWIWEMIGSPTIVLQDMTRLRELWPVEVFDQMKSRQQDLDLMRKSAKKNYQQVRPMPCRFCGKVIRVDMYRHVARLHLDLVQLWRCPIAWCTTWKGSPQDCLEHVRSGHDAPWVEKTASIE